MNEIRLLTKDDIDVRVAQTTSYNGIVKVNLLLYKDARVDMKILDELYGTMGWKRVHKLIGDRLYCEVSVWDNEKKEWINKEDVGVESNTEAEKGQASDSFKRACFNWGIGRELYTAPKIQVQLNDKEYSETGGKIRVYATFQVGDISYDEKARIITGLKIVDRFGAVRYELGKPDRSKCPVASTYKPMREADYNKVLQNYLEGKTAKDGSDYRTAWIKQTGAGAAEIAQFDKDAEDLRIGTIFK